jgi:hypothetical protein
MMLIDFLWQASHPVSIIIILILAGLTGQHFANKWQPWWKLLPFVAFFLFLERFFSYALFERPFIDLSMSLLMIPVMAIVMFLVYRAAMVNLFVKQYPWLYSKNSVWFLNNKTKQDH